MLVFADDEELGRRVTTGLTDGREFDETGRPRDF